MKQAYEHTKFKPESLAMISRMTAIIDTYQKQGYRLTMRQLYYQLVAKDWIPNTVESYKRITMLGNNARLAGLLDWEAIEDRTRDLVQQASWSSASSIVEACADQFHMDMWATQKMRVLVVVEKEALAGVIDRTCTKWDVPYLAARGYPSVTILREIVQSYFYKASKAKQELVILHLGDHDPSGIDMSRDLEQRFNLFANHDTPNLSIDFRRIALNREQVDERDLPPNPAKQTDSRFKEYEQVHGDESWELDALSPVEMDGMIVEHLEELIDRDAWEAREQEIEEGKAKIADAAEWMNDQEEE